MSTSEWEFVDVPTHRLKTSRWVAVLAEIRLNATGEVRECLTNEILDDGEPLPSPYIWEEGSFACDCNRALFYSRAKHGDPERQVACGEGAFSVRLKNKKTGEVYYDEFPALSEVVS